MTFSFGFHSGVSGNHTGIGDHWRKLDAAGIPFFAKSTDGFKIEAANLAKASTVPHTVIFRLTTAAHGYDLDVPIYALPAKEAAIVHWAETKDRLSPELDKSVVWVEVCNEVDKNKAGWIGNFLTEIATIANGEGYKVTGPAWASGEPEKAHWRTPGLIRYLRYCAANPGKAAVSVHEYDYNQQGFGHKDVNGWHVGRFQEIFKVCDEQNIPYPEIHITEFGWSMTSIPPLARCLDELAWAYRHVYAPHGRWVKGAAIWCLQKYQGNIHNDVQRLIAPVTELLMTLPVPTPTPTPSPDPEMPRHKVVVIKLPDKSKIGQSEWKRVAGYAYDDFGRTMTASLGDTIGIIQAVGNEESYVKVYRPGYQLDDIEALTAAKITWEPLVLPDEGEGLNIINISDDLPKHETLVYPKRALSEITALTIHHTVGVSTPVNIALFHINTRGWPGIAYHFLVMGDGTLYQTNHLTTKSFHAGSFAAPGDENLWSVGIALMGDFTRFPPTQAQQAKAKALISFLRATVPTVTKCIPHRGMPGAETQCPGNTWQDWFYSVTGEKPPAPTPAPAPVPSGQVVDLTTYFRVVSQGNGPFFVLQHSDGRTENIQHQITAEGIVYIVKNSAWEELRVFDGYVWRRIDTSPGKGQYYKLADQGFDWSKWCPAVWEVGKLYERKPFVQFFNKSDCKPVGSADPSITYLKFHAHHANWTAPSGIVFSNVAELHWLFSAGGQPAEKYWYAKGIGMVAWENNQGAKSWVAEIPQGRPPLTREVIPCLA